MSKTKQSIFNLMTQSEDSYSGANAQNPKTARKVQSWIPSDDGQLHRELNEPLYLSTALSGPVVGLYEFDQNQGDGTITRFYFAAARTDSTVGTKTCNFYQKVSSAWSEVTAVGTLADAPMCVTQQDNFFLADGVSNWLFDGTDWEPVGMAIPKNRVAIKVNNGSPTVLFDGDVTAYFFGHDHSFNGSCDLNYPTSAGSALATATGNSILFNPPQFNGTPDPNQQPIKWATLNTDGSISGYTEPYSGATEQYTMSVVAKLVIPAPGNYTIAMNHDDGAFFGFSAGENKAGVPSFLGGPFVAIGGSKTAVNGWPILGGTNKSGNWNDSFVVSFPNADTYDLEINYCQWQNEQQLVFLVNGTTPLPTTSANPGTVNSALGRYYWFSNADETAGRATESSTSPIGLISGPTVGAQISVYQQPGLFTSSTSSKSVTGASSSDSPGPVAPNLDSTMAGKKLYINGTAIGTIASVSGNDITLVANAAATTTSGRAVIVDQRATHWHIYASESDGSKIGQFLASVPVTQDLSTDPYVDSSPFIDDPDNNFLPTYRPLRNDPPPPSKLLEVHKIRQWRRRESAPNFFNFTANEEVTSGNNGDPTQCVPGADVNTVSDMVNEVSYPDQSVRLRGLISHTDALYMFSEKQCYPLYGQSVDDFAISQSVAFSLGLAGRFAGKSTKHGLVFISYDKKAFLYPTSSYSTYLATNGAATDSLQEIGRPLRNKLKLMASDRLDEVVSEFYFYGIRDWWIVAFPDASNVYQTWVYDFNTKGWFQLQRGFSSLAVFEVSEGDFVLVGGAPDNKVYVIDDQTGTYDTSGTLPTSTFRPALIDFGDPNNAHVFRSVELEFDSAAMQKDVSVTFWLDPNDVDNPGAGRKLTLRPILGANRYIGMPDKGATCQRMLLSIVAAASANPGVIRGIKLTADTVEGIISANQSGVV